jgi:hypothetical protein
MAQIYLIEKSTKVLSPFGRPENVLGRQNTSIFFLEAALLKKMTAFAQAVLLGIRGLEGYLNKAA